MFERLTIIRHAEKGANHVHLSQIGDVRAKELIFYFAKMGYPQVLVAMKQGKKGHSDRCRETLLRLSRHLKVPIVLFKKGEIHKLCQYLKSDECAAKRVLVAWQHDENVSIARALGIPAVSWGILPMHPDKHAGDVYDVSWILQPYTGGLHFSTYWQFDVVHNKVVYNRNIEHPVYSMEFKQTSFDQLVVRIPARYVQICCISSMVVVRSA